jgi:hypothetical protein
VNEDKNIELAIPSSVDELIGSCETNCVAGCCGLDAFDLREESVREWVQQVGPERATAARRDLDALLVQISTITTTITCHRVNCYWEPWEADLWFGVFASFLDLAGIPSTTPVPSPPKEPPKQSSWKQLFQ